MTKYLPKIFTVLFLTAMLAACSSDDSTTPEQPGENQTAAKLSRLKW
jgi:hypothetical protein